MLVIDSSWCTKIDKFDHILVKRSEMNVLRFDIAMHYVLLMQISKCWKHLSNNFRRLHFSKCLFSCNSLIQSTALTHLVDEIEFLLILVHFDNLADIWMIKLFHKLNFVKQLSALTKFEIFLPHDFDGPRNLRKLVNASSHTAECSLTNDFVKLVMVLDVVFVR